MTAVPHTDPIDLDEMLVTRHLNPRKPGETLRQAIDRILDWEVYVNLDPAVSSEAARLVQMGRDMAWIKASERKPNTGDLIVKGWANGSVWAGIQGPRPHDFGGAEAWLLLQPATPPSEG